MNSLDLDQVYAHVRIVRNLSHEQNMELDGAFSKWAEVYEDSWNPTGAQRRLAWQAATKGADATEPWSAFKGCSRLIVMAMYARGEKRITLSEFESLVAPWAKVMGRTWEDPKVTEKEARDVQRMWRV